MPLKALKNFIDYDDLIYKYIELDGDYMIIESYEIQYDVESGEIITLEGRDLLSLLDNRIVWGQYIGSGTIKSVVNALVTNALVSSSISARNISNFVVDNYGADETIDSVQFTGDNLFDAIISLCGDNYSPIITFSQGYLYFRLRMAYPTPRATFSPEIENLSQIQIYFGTQDYKNATLIGGEGEGSARRYNTVAITSGATKYQANGKYRKEVFTDARNISSNNGEVSTANYNYQLAIKGNETLINNQVGRSITAKIDTSAYIYGLSYVVGDLIKIKYKNNSWTARITEYIRSQDQNGYQEYPNFEIII